MTKREILELVSEHGLEIRHDVAKLLREGAVYDTYAGETKTRVDFVESVITTSLEGFDIRAGIVARQQLGYVKFSNPVCNPSSFFVNGTLRLEVIAEGGSVYGFCHEVFYEVFDDNKFKCRFDVEETVLKAFKDLIKSLKS